MTLLLLTLYNKYEMYRYYVVSQYMLKYYFNQFLYLQNRINKVKKLTFVEKILNGGMFKSFTLSQHYIRICSKNLYGN